MSASAELSRRLGKNGCTGRPVRCTFLDAVTYRDAGEARNHATWISKSRCARFRASSVRDFDEDALETLTERTTPTTTSRQRGIYASIIASVSIVFCHDIDRSTAGCAGVMQASQLVTARSRDRSPRSRAREHMPVHRARQGIAIFSTGAAFG